MNTKVHDRIFQWGFIHMWVLSRIKLAFFLNLDFLKSFNSFYTQPEFCAMQCQPPCLITVWPVGMILHVVAHILTALFSQSKC